MGIVEEVGPEVTKVKKGDRVVVPFNVSCGHCFYCQHEMESQCDNSNPHYDSGGYFGYTEKFGNHPGGQAEYLKVPLETSLPLLSRSHANWRMSHCSFYRMFCQQLIGV